MSERVSAGKTTDIPEGGAKVVAVGGDDVAVFHVDGKFYAMSDSCPHAGGPLSEGEIDGGAVLCPWHGWAFTLDPDDKTPPSDMICKYRVTVEDDEVFVESA